MPKVHPPEKLENLRKIAGLMNFSKVLDKILAEYLIKDMAQPLLVIRLSMEILRVYLWSII